MSGRALSLVAILVVAAAGTAASQECPEESERLATAWPSRPWVCALLEGPDEGEDCPSGSKEVTVTSAPRPFRCALNGADPEPPTGCPKGRHASTDEAGRMSCVADEPLAQAPARPAPACPNGFDPAFTKDTKRGFKCVRTPRGGALGVEAPLARPTNACPPGTRRVRTENPFEPVQCKPEEGALPAPPKDLRYIRYEVPGELRFEYPENWRVTNAWKDEIPSLYLQLDLARDGKPVVIAISRHRRRGKVYQDMDSMIRQEIEWQGAKEGGKGAVAGLPARFLEVPRQTKLAYLRTGDGYFVLGYSAPEDLFRAYAPAYARLLKSLRVVHGDGDPLPEEE